LTNEPLEAWFLNLREMMLHNTPMNLTVLQEEIYDNIPNYEGSVNIYQDLEFSLIFRFSKKMGK